MFQVGQDGDTSNYIPNSEWTLVHLHVARHVVYYSCCAEPYPDITYVIQVCTCCHGNTGSTGISVFSGPMF